MNLKSRGVFKNIPGVFLLLFVVVAIFIPFEITRAAEGLFSFDLFSMITKFTAKLLLGDSEFMTFIYWLAYRIISLGLYLTTVLVYFGSWLIDVFLDEKIYASVLNMNDSTSAVAIGWRTVRDACNTFFILFLLVIAFSTILRIQAYSTKSLLPKLIISLFLINFSAVIAMMVIDLGQVFMFEIKTWMGAGGFSGAGSPLTTIVDYFHNEYGLHEPPPSGVYLMSDVVGVAFAVAYSAILGLLYIMLALFLMVRIIVFVILIIISPFAFFSIILPGMRTYTSQWWQSLVSHAIFGPVFLFFIFLASKMAQSMQTFNSTVPEPADMEPLSYIVAKLIPHVVAMGMLMAAIPVTQKLGVAGANKFIGGAAGIGKIGIGAVAGAKLAGGLGKKVGGGTVGRAHAYAKGKSRRYSEATEKVSGAIKSLPIAGRIKIEHEAKQAEKKKEAISKHEKIMENLTDKDKKKYVDSFKLDKEKQAEARQAMFNDLAKDNGAGLTNKNLQKMVYEKEVADKKVFDEEKFNKDYGQVSAHKHNTSKIETYRPDLINDRDDRLEKIDKIAADGNEKSIKLASLADPEMEARLRKEIGNTRYNNLINSKSQAEKDDLAEIKEDQIIRGMAMHKTNPGDKEALDITTTAGKEELLEKQTEIAYLTGTKGKAKKMRKIKGIDSHLNLEYEHEDDIDPEIAKKVVNKMNTDELIDQNPKFLEDTAHMIEEPDQFRRMNKSKNITTGQSEAIKKSIGKRMREIDPVADKKKYDRLEKAADIMGCGITKPDKKKSDKKPDDEKDGPDYGPSPYGFATSKPQPKQSAQDDAEAETAVDGKEKSETKKEQTTTQKLKKAWDTASALEMKKGKKKDRGKRAELLQGVIEEGGKYNKGLAVISKVANPAFEKQKEIAKRREEGEKIPQWKEDKETLGALTKSLKPLMPEDSEEDGKYIGGVGAGLSKAGENVGGVKGTVLRKTGELLQNEKAQKAISKEIRKKVDQGEEELERKAQGEMPSVVPVPISGNQSGSNRETVRTLEKLAKKGGFDQGIKIDGELGMSAPSGRLVMGSKTIDNLHEAFEADREFAEGGTEDMIRHEEQHSKAYALASSEKMEAKLKEYSEQEGISDEDIKKKKTELVEKYHTGGEKGAGYEMQTEVQRANLSTKLPKRKADGSFEDPDKFVEEEARMHVMADVSEEGLDKLSKIEYGPENPGLDKTHSAFIKQDVLDKITKKMEEMRKDLVAKHEARKGDHNFENDPAYGFATSKPQSKQSIANPEMEKIEPKETPQQPVKSQGSVADSEIKETPAEEGKARKAIPKKAKRLTSQEEKPAIRKAITKESKTIKPKEERALLHQQVFDKMNDINLEALGSIQEKNKGKDPREGLKELDNLKGSLSELVNDSQEIISGKDGGDLPIIAQSVEGGIETARGILQKRIEEQKKGSSGEVELKETPKQFVKPDVKPKVSVEDLEMKDIKEKYEDKDRKNMRKAELGTEQINIAQRLGKKKDSVEVYDKLTKSEKGKTVLFEDKMNDINYKMAEAKKSGGSGAGEVKKLFAEKKKMAKEYVEGANPDLMRDIRFEERKIEQLKIGGHGGRRLNRKSQSRRRGNLDQLQKEKQAKVDEVLSKNKGFRERKPVRIENKVEDKPQSEKTGVGRKLKPTVLKNVDEGVEVAGKGASKVLKKVEEGGGKAGTVLKAAGKVLQSEKEQEVISKKVREKVNQEDEKPEAKRPKEEIKEQPKPKHSINLKEKTEEPDVEKKETKPVKQVKSESASEQWNINKDKEKIIETKESVSKDGLKSSVVKSEISFDPVKAGEKRAKQQIKEMIGGMSKDMKQEVINNINIDSSQEPIDIDLGKLIDTDKIAELIKKEIKTDDVEKTLKKVQKSFKEFKGSNSGNANTPVFKAGISAAQKALDRASAIKDRDLAVKDRNKRAVEFATITNVLGEIEKGIEKENKSSVNKEE